MIKREKLKISKSEKGLKRSFIAFLVVGLLIFTATQAVQAGAATSTKISNIDDKTVIEKGISYLQNNAQDRGIHNAQKEFLLKKITHDNLNEVHVRYDQVYNGIPVYGQEVNVHMKNNGDFLSVTGNYLSGIDTQTVPGITQQDAIKIASTLFSGSPTDTSEAELMLFPIGKKVILVYRVGLEDISVPASIVVFVDAKSGAIVDKYDNLQTPVATSESTGSGISQKSSIQQSNPGVAVPATGTGKSLYLGTISIDTIKNNNLYNMVDSTKGFGSTVSNYMRTSDMKNGKEDQELSLLMRIIPGEIS